MAVSITLPGELEHFLRKQATNLGIPIETLLARTIEERWEAASRATRLPERESELLLRLQMLFPPDQTREYRNLCEKSDCGTITEPERNRLLTLIEARDQENAERLEIVADLAALRGLSLREMMRQLGIRPE